MASERDPLSNPGTCASHLMWKKSVYVCVGEEDVSEDVIKLKILRRGNCSGLPRSAPNKIPYSLMKGRPKETVDTEEKEI